MIKKFVYAVKGLISLLMNTCPECHGEVTTRWCHVCHSHHISHRRKPTKWHKKSWYRRYMDHYKE